MFHGNANSPGDRREDEACRLLRRQGVARTRADNELHTTCDDLRVHAAAFVDAATDEARRAHHAALCVAVERHLACCDRSLSQLAKRALLHDHRRMAQMSRAITLAADNGDVRAAAQQARRLAELAAAHDERETSYR
jgi:hypothetical protein